MVASGVFCGQQLRTKPQAGSSTGSQSQMAHSESSNKSKYSICASSHPSLASNIVANSSSPITIGAGSDGVWWVTGVVLVMGACVVDGVLEGFFTRLVEERFRHRRDVTFVMPRLLLRRPSSSRSISNRQKPPLPGSSLERGTFTKHLFKDRLCRIEFCGTQHNFMIRIM
jgi:hypothetical protein